MEKIKATRNTQAGGHPIISGKEYAVAESGDRETTIGLEDAKALVRIGKAVEVKATEDLSKLSEDELKARLTALGVAFDAKAKKTDLLKLLKNSES